MPLLDNDHDKDKLMATIGIKIEGLDGLSRSFAFFEHNAANYMSAAAKEAVERQVLNQPGVKQYPEETAANQPGRMRAVTFSGGKVVNFRMPYYIRGRGTMTPVRGGGWKNLGNSERYGTKWIVNRLYYGAELGNSASYMPYLTDENRQAQAMKRIGWRKARDVAIENMDKINAIFEAWVRKLWQDAILK